jgi:hypothetical protein
MESPSAEACRGEWHSPDHQRGSHHTGVLHFITLVALRNTNTMALYTHFIVDLRTLEPNTYLLLLGTSPSTCR